MSRNTTVDSEIHQKPSYFVSRIVFCKNKKRDYSASTYSTLLLTPQFINNQVKHQDKSASLQFGRTLSIDLVGRVYLCHSKLKS